MMMMIIFLLPFSLSLSFFLFAGSLSIQTTSKPHHHTQINYGNSSFGSNLEGGRHLSRHEVHFIYFINYRHELFMCNDYYERQSHWESPYPIPHLSRPSPSPSPSTKPPTFEYAIFLLPPFASCILITFVFPS